MIDPRRTQRLVAARGAGAALALLSVLALAPVARAGDSPWSVRVQAGAVETDATFGPPVLGREIDDDDTTVGVGLAYRFGRHLEARAGYHDLGEHEALPAPCPPGEICPLALDDDLVLVAPATAEVDALSLSLVPRLPLGERFSLFAEVGAVHWDVDIESDAGVEPEGGSGTDLLLGAGAGWELASGLSFEVELAAFDLEARSLTAGVGWRF